MHVCISDLSYGISFVLVSSGSHGISCRQKSLPSSYPRHYDLMWTSPLIQAQHSIWYIVLLYIQKSLSRYWWLLNMSVSFNVRSRKLYKVPQQYDVNQITSISCLTTSVHVCVWFLILRIAKKLNNKVRGSWMCTPLRRNWFLLAKVTQIKFKILMLIQCCRGRFLTPFARIWDQIILVSGETSLKGGFN